VDQYTRSIKSKKPHSERGESRARAFEVLIRLPRVVVDGVSFQYQSSGIARVRTALLEEWAKSGFIENAA
jgi:hypothetical protein